MVCPLGGQRPSLEAKWCLENVKWINNRTNNNRKNVTNIVEASTYIGLSVILCCFPISARANVWHKSPSIIIDLLVFVKLFNIYHPIRIRTPVHLIENWQNDETGNRWDYRILDNIIKQFDPIGMYWTLFLTTANTYWYQVHMAHLLRQTVFGASINLKQYI